MAAARDKYVAARTQHLSDGLGEDDIWRVRSKMVVLGSTGTHSSTQKAANILGLRFEAIRAYEEDSFFPPRPALGYQAGAARGEGPGEPFFLTATMGTTDFCVIDDFEGIADVLKQRLARGRYPDVYNLVLTGYDCSATFVRSREDLINTLSIKPAYLRNRPSDDDTIEYRDWQIALGKRFRSLKLWVLLRSYGISSLQARVRNGISIQHGGKSRAKTTYATGTFHRLYTGTLRACDSESGGTRCGRDERKDTESVQ
ncbi:hypothetical protein E4U40_004597 [Claviceps sp. LM458 group G5]|nr:hypothetical protein E4U40_004597 [Claviceps sp. LM458 group G5]